jgi:hydrogenase expression/formation protein HypE
MDEEVEAFCEILGLEPMYMGNEGKLVAIVKGEDAEKALELVRSTPHGKNARIIGNVLEGKGVQMTTRLGGNRVVDVLYGEGLPRIC